METDAIRKYLKLLMSAVADSTTDSEIIESEDGPVLFCSVKSPFENCDDLGYQFTITPVDNGLLAVEVIIFIFNDVDSGKFAGINALAAKINPYLAIGSFKLFEDSGSVLLTQGTIVDEALDTSSVTGIIGQTVSLLENILVNAGEYIYRYLNGDELEKLIEEIEKEDL